MKLELVMLTTVISMITEVQVEAQLECYENDDFTGKKATITKSIKDTTNQFTNGPRACKVSPNSSVIFYSKPDFLGEIHTFHTRHRREYRPSPGFTIKSILILAKNGKEEIFFFRNKDFQGGLYQKFSGEIEKVKGNMTFESAVVKGRFWHWTIARECHLTNCERKCLICLQPEDFGISFFRSINSAGMSKTLSVLPELCLGTKYTGFHRITACGCDMNGVADKNNPCHPNGTCICNNESSGKLCEICAYNAFRESSNKQCTACNCKDNGNKTINGRFRICNETSGNCYGDGYIKLFLPQTVHQTFVNKILTCGTNPCEVISVEASIASGEMRFYFQKVLKIQSPAGWSYQVKYNVCTPKKVTPSAPFICKKSNGRTYKEKSLDGKYWIIFEAEYRKRFKGATVKVTLKGSAPKLADPPSYSYYYG